MADLDVYTAPEGYEDMYTEPEGSWEESRDDLQDARDSAMDWMDEYYKSPEEAELVSTRLDNLLADDSAYLQAARESSRKARDERGYLESGFTEGMGEVSAIDKAFDVALDDAYVDVFNINEQNQANRTEWLTAYESAMRALTYQGEQTYKEHQYELLIHGMDEVQDDLLELKDKEYEYADLLQASQHNANMDRLYFKSANDVAMRTMRDKAGLQKFYLNNYTAIAGSDISQADKYDQLVGLGYQIDAATRQAVDQQYTKIGDNPYGISHIDYLDAYNIGQRSDEMFVWSKADSDYEFVKLMDTVNNIRDEIYAQTNHAERDASNLWYIMSDLLWVQMNGIDKNSQLYLDKMEYYNRTKNEALGNDPTNAEIEAYFYTMYELTTPQLAAQNAATGVGVLIDGYGWVLPPTDYTWKEWDSATGSVITKSGFYAGDDAYKSLEWKRYEDCVSEWGTSASWCRRPTSEKPVDNSRPLEG